MKRMGGGNQSSKSIKTPKEHGTCPGDSSDSLSGIIITSTYHIGENEPSTSQSAAQRKNDMSSQNFETPQNSLTCLLCAKPLERDSSLAAPKRKRRKGSGWSSARKKKKDEPLSIPDHSGLVTVFARALMSFESISKIKFAANGEEPGVGYHNWIQFFSPPETDKRSENPVENLPWTRDHPCCDNCYRKLERFDDLTFNLSAEEAVANAEVEEMWEEILTNIRMNTPRSSVKQVWRSLKSSLLKFTNAEHFGEILTPNNQSSSEAVTNPPNIFQNPEAVQNADAILVMEESEAEVQFWFENVKEEPSNKFPSKCSVCDQSFNQLHDTGNQIIDKKGVSTSSIEDCVREFLSLHSSEEEDETVAFVEETSFLICENCSGNLRDLHIGSKRLDENCKEVKKLEEKLNQKLKELKETAKLVKLELKETNELLTYANSSNQSTNVTTLRIGMSNACKKVDRILADVELKLSQKNSIHTTQLADSNTVSSNSLEPTASTSVGSLLIENQQNEEGTHVAAITLSSVPSEPVTESKNFFGRSTNNATESKKGLLNANPDKIEGNADEEFSNENDEANESREMSRAMRWLEEQFSDDIRSMYSKMPAPIQFHEIVVQYEKSKELLILKTPRIKHVETPNFQKMEMEQHYVYTTPKFLQAIENIELEGRTLDILFGAGMNFVNTLDRLRQNVLFYAIKGQRSTSFIKELISRGVNVMQVNSNGQNLLHFACEFGCSPEILKLLLDRGLALNGMDNKKETPLHKLKDLKRLKLKPVLFKILVKSGGKLCEKIRSTKETALHTFFCNYNKIDAGIFHDLIEFLALKNRLGLFNAQDKLGQTPLQLAVRCCEIKDETLDILSDFLVDFKLADNSNESVLHYAIKGRKSVRFLKSLVERGADINRLTKNNDTILHFAAKEDAPVEIFEYCLGNPSVDIKAFNSSGRTALALAMSSVTDQSILTQLFIASFDAGLREINKQKLSIYIAAVEYGSFALLNHFLNNGLDVNYTADDGDTPFLAAIRSWIEPIEKIKLLIKHGADIGAMTKSDRREAVHHATKWGEIETLEYCLEKLRLDPNAKDKNEKTPLVAILRRSLGLVESQYASRLEKGKLLVKYGADVRVKWLPTYNYGYWFYPSKNFKIHRKEQTLLHLGLSICKEPGSVLLLEYLQFLIQNGADVNEPDEDGWTPLHQAMTLHSRIVLELATFLLENGADINAKTKEGETIMHIATKKESIDGMKFCLSKGLSVNEKDRSGNTPLYYSIIPSVSFFNYKDQTWPKFGKIDNMLKRFHLCLKNGPSLETKSDLVSNINEIEKVINRHLDLNILERNIGIAKIGFLNQLKSMLD